ncbi:MAG: hypothetical protein RLZZ625_746 [Pseudomonadota bacterium]
MKQMLLALSPTPKQSFENFVVGHNIEVIHTLKQIISHKLPIQFIINCLFNSYIFGVTKVQVNHIWLKLHLIMDL